MAKLYALLLVLLALISPPLAQAGFVEVGVSGSSKRSNIDRDAFDESQSLTGSLAYYFDESSAVELSYTDGTSRRVIGETSVTGHNTTMYYKTAGLDFILTIGEREATIRPYVKLGVVYIFEKRILDQYRDAGGPYPATEIKDSPALVPSGGIGFKLILSKNWSLKVGAEAWTSRPVNEQPVTVDYSGKAGLSWMF